MHSESLRRRKTQKLRYGSDHGFRTNTVDLGAVKSKMIDAAEAWQADLIAPGSHRLKGLERFVMGVFRVGSSPCALFGKQREDRSQGAPLPEEKRKGRLKKKKGNAPQFDLRERVVSHDRCGPDPDRRHRCHDRDGDPQRSGMGYEQMGDRGSFRFLAAAVSRQSHQRRQNHWERSTADEQSARIALRMAASTLRLSKTYLGAQFRRLRTRLGAPIAIKAMAAKLARLIYRMLRYGM